MPHLTRSHPPTDANAPLIIFDFDGTVCLGDAPALAYAESIDATPGISGTTAALEAFIADPRSDPRFAECDDPYDVVNIAAAESGISPAQRSAAYLASRARAATLPVWAPAGLNALLDELHAELVLFTNAPDTGLAGLLETLGLTGAFHSVVTDGNKPAGMHEFVAPHRAAGRAVLSIGDKWFNDLAPVAALGGSTALVDSYTLALGHPADYTAPSLDGLYPDIRKWDARHRDAALTNA